MVIPISLLDRDETTGIFVLNEGFLQRIFINEIEPDCEVSIISIAGAFRKGKSFILNFFLRYLKADPEQQVNGNWLNMEQEVNDGFEWKNGCHAHTSGILIWPEIFYQTNEGRRIAIILMDTQGVFAPNSSNIENVGIFAFSTMLSSVQIFNVSQTIQEDNLQHLQLFTEYARLASEHSAVEPFQNLWFLVRDWQDDENYPYGGGETFLNECLEVNPVQSPELRSVRNHINNSFEEINCFLMPHPGMEVVRGRFTGNLNVVEDDFIDYAKLFVPMILETNNLIIKKINGRVVLGRDLFAYINSFWNLFMDGSIPTPQTMLEATIRATCNTAKNHAYEIYMNMMNTFTSSNEPENEPLENTEFLSCHATSKNEALQIFNEETTIGRNDLREPYRVMLTEFIERNMKIFRAINDGKRRRIQTTKLQRQLKIFGAVFVLGLGSMFFVGIPTTIPAAATYLETTLATYLPEITLSDLVVGIGEVVTLFGPYLIEKFRNFSIR